MGALRCRPSVFAIDPTFQYTACLEIQEMLLLTLDDEPYCCFMSAVPAHRIVVFVISPHASE